MEIPTISTEELQDIIATEDDVPIVNVLAQEEYEEAHIPGSHHVGLRSEDFVAQIDDLVDGDQDRKVVVYCASKSCDASPQAAEKLYDAGYENVLDYAGGMKAWQQAGLPVASGTRA